MCSEMTFFLLIHLFLLTHPQNNRKNCGFVVCEQVNCFLWICCMFFYLFFHCSDFIFPSPWTHCISSLHSLTLFIGFLPPILKKKKSCIFWMMFLAYSSNSMFLFGMLCKNIPKDSPKRVNNFQHSLLLSVALVLVHFKILMPLVWLEINSMLVELACLPVI